MRLNNLINEPVTIQHAFDRWFHVPSEPKGFILGTPEDNFLDGSGCAARDGIPVIPSEINSTTIEVSNTIIDESPIVMDASAVDEPCPPVNEYTFSETFDFFKGEPKANAAEEHIGEAEMGFSIKLSEKV